MLLQKEIGAERKSAKWPSPEGSRVPHVAWGGAAVRSRSTRDSGSSCPSLLQSPPLPSGRLSHHLPRARPEEQSHSIISGKGTTFAGSARFPARDLRPFVLRRLLAARPTGFITIPMSLNGLSEGRAERKEASAPADRTAEVGERCWGGGGVGGGRNGELGEN